MSKCPILPPWGIKNLRIHLFWANTIMFPGGMHASSTHALVDSPLRCSVTCCNPGSAEESRMQEMMCPGDGWYLCSGQPFGAKLPYCTDRGVGMVTPYHHPWSLSSWPQGHLTSFRDPHCLIRLHCRRWLRNTLGWTLLIHDVCSLISLNAWCSNSL